MLSLTILILHKAAHRAGVPHLIYKKIWLLSSFLIFNVFISGKTLFRFMASYKANCRNALIMMEFRFSAV